MYSLSRWRYCRRVGDNAQLVVAEGESVSDLPSAVIHLGRGVRLRRHTYTVSLNGWRGDPMGVSNGGSQQLRAPTPTEEIYIYAVLWMGRGLFSHRVFSPRWYAALRKHTITFSFLLWPPYGREGGIEMPHVEPLVNSEGVRNGRNSFL